MGPGQVLGVGKTSQESLRSKGHEIYVPTLSGLGERSHLAKFDIDLDVHILDVGNEMKWKDPGDVVLG